MVVATRQQARPGRRAQRRRVPLAVGEAVGGQPVQGRHVDPAAVGRPGRQPGVVVEHHQHVRRALRRAVGRNADQSGVDSRTSSLMSPLNGFAMFASCGGSPFQGGAGQDEMSSPRRVILVLLQSAACSAAGTGGWLIQAGHAVPPPGSIPCRRSSSCRRLTSPCSFSFSRTTASRSIPAVQARSRSATRARALAPDCAAPPPARSPRPR